MNRKTNEYTASGLQNSDNYRSNTDMFMIPAKFVCHFFGFYPYLCVGLLSFVLICCHRPLAKQKTSETHKDHLNPFLLPEHTDWLVVSRPDDYTLKSEAVYILLDRKGKAQWRNRSMVYREAAPDSLVRVIWTKVDATNWEALSKIRFPNPPRDHIPCQVLVHLNDKFFEITYYVIGADEVSKLIRCMEYLQHVLQSR